MNRKEAVEVGCTWLRLPRAEEGAHPKVGAGVGGTAWILHSCPLTQSPGILQHAGYFDVIVYLVKLPAKKSTQVYQMSELAGHICSQFTHSTYILYVTSAYLFVM